MVKKEKLEEILTKAGYSAKALKLYMNKVNVGTIENADIASTYMSLLCGDTITLYLKTESDLIKEAKFDYCGCAGTATSGSALTTLTLGKTIQEASKITKDDVLKELDGLPESHCADLAIGALRQALEGLKEKAQEHRSS